MAGLEKQTVPADTDLPQSSDAGVRLAAAPSGVAAPALARVLVGVDFQASSLAAASWVAHDVAPGAELLLVHVLELPRPASLLRRLADPGERLWTAAVAGATERLQGMAASVGREQLRTYVEGGDVSRSLVRVAVEEDADVIAIGEYGPARGVAAVLGSTAERVLQQGRLPLLLVRRPLHRPPRRVLVALDESAAREPLLAWARFLARGFGATLQLLHVVCRAQLFDELRGLPDARALQALEEENAAAMQRWLQEQARAVGLDEAAVQARVCFGSPAYEVIAEAARGAVDLVVLGTRGAGGVVAPLLGGVATKVLRSAPCSVLVVPAGPDG